MQMKHQFRMKVLALGVLAALGSGQVMAEAIVTSDGSNQTDRISYDIPSNTASMNISGNASTATTSTNVSGGTASVTSLTNTGNTDLQGAIYNSTANNSGAVYVDDNLVVTGTTYTYGNSNIGAGNGAVNVIGGNTATSNTIHSVTNTIVGVDNNIIGTTNTITGTTNINTTGTASTYIGNTTGTASLTGSAVYIATGSSTAKEVNIGNTNTGTAIYSSAGASHLEMTNTSATMWNNNSTLSVANGAASLTSGSFGYNSYSAGKTVTDSSGAATSSTNYRLTAGDLTSQQTVTNALGGGSVQNVIVGNTLIDGNVFINGSLTYSSNSAATTTVTNQTTGTSAGMTVVNAGQTGGVSVDANGKMTAGAGAQTQASAALTVTNQIGNTHGFVVNETSATMSGGANSTSLTLNDSGARFSNSATGAPVTVTGVADGKQDFDAVNYRQLKQIAAGVAGVSAMANIPQVDQNKTFAIGAGIGQFQSQTALALGASYRFAPNAVVKASVSTTSGNSSSKNTVYGVGAGFSW